MGAIAHLIETGGPGGAENIFLSLASQLKIEGTDSVAIIGREGWLSDQARQRGLAVEIAPAQGSLSVRYLQDLCDICRRRNVRLIIAHLFGASVYASAVGLLQRKPIIGVFHGQSDISDHERFLPAKRLLIKLGSSHTVFVSEILKTALQPRLRLDEQRTSIIENGIDLARFRQTRNATLRKSLGIPESTLLIGAVGNIRAPKGYDVLLNVAARVCSERAFVHFVIAGDTNGDTYPQISALSERLGLSGRVHFLGLRNDVAEILSAIDVYVLSSHSEGFSLSLVEGMASGRAVVATRSGGPQMLVDDESTGLLVPTKDERALGDALLRVIDDSALRAKLGAAASASMSTRFSVERMLGDYRTLVKSILQAS